MKETVSECPRHRWCEWGGANIHRIHEKTEFFVPLGHGRELTVKVVAEMDGPIRVDVQVPDDLPLETAHQLGLALLRVNTSYNM